MLDVACLLAALGAFVAFVALVHAAAIGLAVRRHAGHLGQRTGRDADAELRAELRAFEASRPALVGEGG